jgi:DNA modification methylase
MTLPVSPLPAVEFDKFVMIEYDLLMENEDNPRLIKEHKFKKLVDSLCEFPEMLQSRPCVVISEGLKYKILGGNMRYKAIPAAIRKLTKLVREKVDGYEVWEKNLSILKQGVPSFIADTWSEEKRSEFVIKDNVSYGEHDWEILANKWDAKLLDHWGMDIPVMEKVLTEPEPDNFDMEPPVIPFTYPGDVYEFGGHRLICGDCTSMDDIAKLMDGKKVNLTFTSPPYWVGMDYETQKSEAEIDDFIESVSMGLISATNGEYGRIVINTGTSSIHRIEKKRKTEILPLIDKWQRSLRDGGWLMRHLRIWVKRGHLPASISPKVDVVDQHNEYIATFEKEWSQLITFWNAEEEQRGQEKLGLGWAQQGVWDDVHGERSAGGRHIAAFPVEIPFRNILLYTKKGESVLDVFGGSGTTMIACEQLGRNSYMTEISPAYCDVILHRWLQYRKGHSLTTEIKRNGKPFTITT